jgi:uncharacterized protein
MKQLTFTCMAWLALALSASAHGASFPCEKAAAAIEKTICASQEVSQLDEYLGRYFEGAKLAVPHAASCLLSDQKTWLKQVRGPCTDATCLKRVYLDRLAVLHALQPGMSMLRNVALPKVPPLVWVIGPAGDAVAAPRNLPTKPLVAQGKIVNDIKQGDGYVLQSSKGVKYLLMSAMLLESPTEDALNSLASMPNAVYEVRGQTHAGGQNTNAFDEGRCTFVYRLAP